MVHVPAKCQENTAMGFLVTERKRNLMDGRTDGQTDGQTDRQTDGGLCNISRPEPSARREIINIERLWERYHYPINFTQWNVVAVVLAQFLLLTKWYPSEY